MMNETLDLHPEQTTALTIIPRASLPTILVADEKDILGSLLKELEGWEPDVSTERGRKEIASKAQKVRVAKADFGRLADKLKEDAIKTQRSVNAEFKILEARMNELVDRVRGPLDEYETAEKARIKANEDAIAAMEALTVNLALLPSDEIKARADSIQPFAWSIEFKARAEKVHADVLARLRVGYAEAVQREKDAAELARLKSEEAERQRLAEIEAQRQREERIAAEAAERATREAEARAAREAAEAEERAQAALRAQAEAAERREREAAEALARAERERVEAEARAERERVAALKREQEAAEAAERNRLAAIEAERQRVAREAAAEQAEAERRAADKAHRGRINREVLTVLVGALMGVDGTSQEEAETFAKAAIVAIASGIVPHVSIQY